MGDEKKKTIPNGMKFMLSGMAGMGATCVVQPLDLVKTRMQLSGGKEFKNSFDCIRSVVVKEGPLGLYKGIGAGLLRQATYTTARLGVYQKLNDHYRETYHANPTVGASILMGMCAGAVGAAVGTPAEVALIRMSADGRLPPAERRNYKNVVNALTRIVREEGFMMLFSGCLPTVGRAMVVNMTQLSAYSQAKRYLHQTMGMAEGIKLHFCSSMLSGFLTTVASMPVDIAKTRIQNMKTVNGVAEYKGTVDVLTKILRNEGVLALWRGFTPYFCRVGPHTVLMFIFFEQLNKAYSRYVLGIEGGGSSM